MSETQGRAKQTPTRNKTLGAELKQTTYGLILQLATTLNCLDLRSAIHKEVLSLEMLIRRLLAMNTFKPAALRNIPDQAFAETRGTHEHKGHRDAVSNMKYQWQPHDGRQLHPQ